MVVLIFFVVDATRLCDRFIKNLSDAQRTIWPGKTLKAYGSERNMDKELLDEWLVLQVITERTKVVTKMIYYPFTVLFVMIISRSSYFDHFDWPIALLLIYGMNSAYALFCAMSLRRTAEKARRIELERLQQKLVSAHGKGEKKRAKQIELTIDEIDAIEEGAFAPLSKHPIIGALLMPLGGAGVLTLLNFLAGR